MPKKVLIVEDDANIAELLHLYLEKEGFQTQVAKDGGKGIELFRSFQPDLVLLDIMLPIMDGWSVLKKIREGSGTPVIMLTAKGETEDKVSGLEQGADDYIVKPFEMKEVLARIHAVLRRSLEPQSNSAPVADETLVCGPVSMDVASHEVRIDGVLTAFPLKEFEVLEYLMRNKGRVLTRQQLIGRVWGSDYVGDTKTLDVHIKRIRAKIEHDPSNPSMLTTVRGLGYRISGESSH